MFIKKMIGAFFSLYLMVLSTNSFAGNIVKLNYTIKSGDSLIALLNKSKIKGDDIQNLLYKTKNSEKITGLKVGQKLIVYKDNKGELKKLVLELDETSVYIASSDKKSGFVIQDAKFKTSQVNQYVIGQVKYSVNKTLKEMTLSDKQIKEFKEMFGSKVDFSTIKKGTTFVAIFPEYYNGSNLVSTGSLLSAEISYKNKELQVFAFNDHTGSPA